VGVVIDRAGSQEVTVSFGGLLASVGLIAEDRLAVGLRITSVVVTTRSNTSYSLDGPLSAYLTAPHWVAAGTIGPFVVFSNQRARGPFWLGRSTVDTGGLQVRVVSSSPWTPTETVAITSAAPATIVRSVADIPGWSATGEHDGRSGAILLRRDGLVQSFAVPEGTTLVTFAYAAPGLGAGLAASGLGLAAMVLLGLAAIALSRRRVTSDEPDDAAGAVQT
jgi:hypothetical protein